MERYLTPILQKTEAWAAVQSGWNQTQTSLPKDVYLPRKCFQLYTKPKGDRDLGNHALHWPQMGAEEWRLPVAKPQQDVVSCSLYICASITRNIVQIQTKIS